MYKRIRDLREDHDYKQSEVAEVLNITQQQYSKIEIGITEITADILIKLSEFYNVSIDYLLGKSNDS